MSWKSNDDKQKANPRTAGRSNSALGTIPLAPLEDAAANQSLAPGFGSGGSFIMDNLGHILAFDRAMEKLTGWVAFEVVGQHKDMGVYERPDDSGLRRFQARPLFEGTLPCVERSSTTRLNLNRKDGAQLEAEVVIAPLGGQGTRYSVEIRRVVARIGAPVRPAEKEELDALTRLPTAAAFRDQLRETFGAVQRTGHTLASLFVHIDHFEKTQSRVGEEQVADIVQRLAGILRATLRSTDYIARLGEDRFGILLTGAGRGDARHVGGRIRQTIEKFAFTRPGGAGELRVTVSIGVACYPADGETPSELIRRAEEALEEAHRLGRNRVWCYVRRPRIHVDFPVYFDGPAGHLLGKTKDLSNSGIFVETHEMLPEGMRLGLSFRLPESTSKIRVMGRVARQVSPDPGQVGATPGLGIEFERYNPEDRRRIEAFIHKSRT